MTARWVIAPLLILFAWCLCAPTSASAETHAWVYAYGDGPSGIWAVDDADDLSGLLTDSMDETDSDHGHATGHASAPDATAGLFSACPPGYSLDAEAEIADVYRFRDVLDPEMTGGITVRCYVRFSATLTTDIGAAEISFSRDGYLRSVHRLTSDPDQQKHILSEYDSRIGGWLERDASASESVADLFYFDLPVQRGADFPLTLTYHASVSTNPGTAFDSTADAQDGGFMISFESRDDVFPVSVESDGGFNQSPLWAAFTASPDGGEPPVVISFTDTTLGAPPPTSWLWDFGDGATSTEQNPTHEYANPGVYTVRLSVSSRLADNQVIRPDCIRVVVIPIPDFTASVTEGVVPLEVVFTDTSTGDVAAWSWDFGDGEGATVQDPTHVFTEAGRYTVRLVVDSGYDTHEVTKSNYITVAFTDMGLDNWAADAVFACADAGIVAGYDDGLYHPEWPVTRDQMAVYISRALAGGDSNVPEFTDTPTFPDVPEDNWALDYIEYAVDQGVVTGYDDGNYHPEYEVTRDQMAVYVARALVAPTGEAALADYVPSDPRNFPDVPDTSWAYKHIEYCVENGVVQGYLDGYYHPEITVTRDQMAVYVARAFGLPM